VHKLYLLIPLLALACQQTAPENTSSVPTTDGATNKKTRSFKVLSTSGNADSGAYELNGIRVTVVNTLPMQNINISLQGKRLINYLHAIDSPTTGIPVPSLVTTNKDTIVVVDYQQQRYSFRIKENKATLIKQR
jgi:hypothetical protein